MQLVSEKGGVKRWFEHSSFIFMLNFFLPDGITKERQHCVHVFDIKEKPNVVDFDQNGRRTTFKELGNIGSFRHSDTATKTCSVERGRTNEVNQHVAKHKEHT